MSLLSYNLPDGLVSSSLHLQHFGSLFAGQGAMTNGSFEVSAQTSPNMSVKVSGSANDDKLLLITDDGDTYFIKNTADLNVTILSNSSGVTKTDAIVAYLNLTAGDDSNDGSPGAAHVIAVRRAGVSTGAPTDGEIDSAASNNPWFRLATVVVLNGETEITGAEITDTRSRNKIWLPIDTDTVNTDAILDDAVDYSKVADGFPLQVVTATSSAVATGTTAVPNDDTIPQNSEGDEYLTLSITPKLATSKLIVEGVMWFSHSASTPFTLAVFRDSTAGALAAATYFLTIATEQNSTPFYAESTSGSISATTFKIRAGGATGATTTLNGVSGARKYGTVIKSYIKITEVKA